MPKPLIDITPSVWVSLAKGRADISLETESLVVPYGDVPAVARALAVIKESKEYAAYLKREGLA